MRVLSDQNGFQRSYNIDPYQDYESISGLIFDANLKNSKYHPKGKVIGIELCGKAKAYSYSELNKSQFPAKDIFNKIPIQLYFDRQT